MIQKLNAAMMPTIGAAVMASMVALDVSLLYAVGTTIAVVGALALGVPALLHWSR